MNLLKKMVQIYSPSYEEQKLAKFLVKELKKRGFKAYLDKVGNAVGIKGKGKPEIVLEAHMDTVPGKLPVKMKKGVLWGRGVVDTKGTLAAMIEAATISETDKTVAVVGTVEEECPTSKGAWFLSKSFKPNYCIVGEPSGWNSVTVGYKGVLNFSYSLKRKREHFSSGNSAANDLIQFVNDLKKEIPDSGNGFSETGFELRKIEADDQKAEAKIVLRVPLGFNFKKMKKIIKQKAGKAKIIFLQELEAIKVEKNNLLVRSFLKSIRKEKGKPGFKIKTGTSDMNILAKKWPCPIVTYGCGDSKLDHTDKEHLSKKEFEKTVRILKNVIESL